MRLVACLSLILGCMPCAWSGAATTVEEAEALTAAGLTAMHDASDDPKRIVDAALDFADALAYYEEHQDVDKMCDLRADIFWCKKRMSLDSLNDYLAQKHKDPKVTATLAHVDKVADTAVPLSEAGDYFSRAQAFADKHPDDWQQISIHYFEIAERFQGSDISLKAQRLSLDAQTRYAQMLSDTSRHQRDTLFTKQAVAGTKSDPPSADELRDNIAKVKLAFKDEFAKTKPRSRAALIKKLLDQGQETSDDLALRYALYSSARDLAIAQHDPAHALCACDLIANAYNGPDQAASRKSVLMKISNPVALAMLKLLDTPTDPEANAVAGKYFCFEADDWPTGLPMVAKSPDKILVKLAEMEMSEPTKTAQMTELADAWYDNGKKITSTERLSFFERALFWYELVLPDTQNITHTIVSKRIDEISDLLPLSATPNYDHLTNGQWEKIHSPVYQVQAAAPRTETDLKLESDQSVRVVPNPSDVWHVYLAQKNLKLDVTAKGDDSPNHVGALLIGVARNGQAHRDLVVKGPGLLWFCTDIPRARGNRADGVIRVKVVPNVDE